MLTTYLFFFLVQQPPWTRASSFTRFVHTTTHHSRYDFSGRVISSSQRPLPDNTQHSQQTDIHVPGGIRTHNPSKRAAADPRLRPRGYWDWLRCFSQSNNNEKWNEESVFLVTTKEHQFSFMLLFCSK
jgi:hypothetical protein